MTKKEDKKPDRTGNMNDRLMKALRTVNFLSGRSMDEASLKKHRRAVEWVGRLASPKGDIRIRSFNVGDIPCEEITPEYAYNPNYAILYAHGGGYVSGGLGYARILGAKLALATGFRTYTFAYRLAPENPYPAALTDGMTMWDHLTENLYLPDHVLLAGDSAGGNMVLCMTRELNGKKLPIPRMLLLFSPWTDMTGTSDTYDSNKDRDPILTREYILDTSKAYIAGAGTPDDSRFSPLFGDLSGFPPALIMAGKNEILLDDSIRLKDRIIKCGGNARLDIEAKGWHVYQQMPIRMAERAMKRLSEYVSTEIYGKEPG